MLRLAMGVTKIEVAQINRQRHRCAQDAHGIALVNRKITKHQQTPDRAALPKSEGDHAFPGPFRSDPLDQKTEAEHEAAAQAHDFPRVNQNSEHMSLGEKLEAVHIGSRFLQGAAVYKPPSIDLSGST